MNGHAGTAGAAHWRGSGPAPGPACQRTSASGWPPPPLGCWPRPAASARHAARTWRQGRPPGGEMHPQPCAADWPRAGRPDRGQGPIPRLCCDQHPTAAAGRCSQPAAQHRFRPSLRLGALRDGVHFRTVHQIHARLHCAGCAAARSKAGAAAVREDSWERPHSICASGRASRLPRPAGPPPPHTCCAPLRKKRLLKHIKMK